MKIVIVGASGTIGAAVSELLAQDHQVIRVGHSQGDARVDMRDPASIRALFEQIGSFDALVVASGSVAFNALTEMTDEQWQVGLQSKLMGQINLTRCRGEVDRRPQGADSGHRRQAVPRAPWPRRAQ